MSNKKFKNRRTMYRRLEELVLKIKGTRLGDGRKYKTPDAFVEKEYTKETDTK